LLQRFIDPKGNKIRRRVDSAQKKRKSRSRKEQRGINGCSMLFSLFARTHTHTVLLWFETIIVSANPKTKETQQLGCPQQKSITKQNKKKISFFLVSLSLSLCRKCVLRLSQIGRDGMKKKNKKRPTFLLLPFALLFVFVCPDDVQ
jgi:hypothetical protein